MRPNPELVVFRRQCAWALMPLPAGEETSALPPDPPPSSLRWLDSSRNAPPLWPEVAGRPMGWIARSPLNVTLRPNLGVEVNGTEADIALWKERFKPLDEWKVSADARILRAGTPGLRAYQGMMDRQWDDIFYPVGAGFLEWRLGWDVEIPANSFLLTLPYGGLEELQVGAGVLAARTLLELNDKAGFSLAARPLKTVAIRRGQPIARLVLLGMDSIRSEAKFAEADGTAVADETED